MIGMQMFHAAAQLLKGTIRLLCLIFLFLIAWAAASPPPAGAKIDCPIAILPCACPPPCGVSDPAHLMQTIAEATADQQSKDIYTDIDTSIAQSDKTVGAAPVHLHSIDALASIADTEAIHESALAADFSNDTNTIFPAPAQAVSLSLRNLAAQSQNALNTRRQIILTSYSLAIAFLADGGKRNDAIQTLSGQFSSSTERGDSSIRAQLLDGVQIEQTILQTLVALRATLFSITRDTRLSQ